MPSIQLPVFSKSPNKFTYIDLCALALSGNTAPRAKTSPHKENFEQSVTVSGKV